MDFLFVAIGNMKNKSTNFVFTSYCKSHLTFSICSALTQALTLSDRSVKMFTMWPHKQTITPPSRQSNTPHLTNTATPPSG